MGTSSKNQHNGIQRLTPEQVLRCTETVQEESLSILDILSGKIIKENLAVNNAYLYSIRRKALPIIFVPGIMGSRLFSGTVRGKIWDPDAIVFTLLETIAYFSAQKRHQRIVDNIEQLSVLEDDWEHNAKFSNKYPHGVQRGWGGVYWGAYGNLLKDLDDWATPLKLFLDLPVYAFGYNWMLSNQENGEKLAERIDELCTKHEAEQVVIITHSMGGMVARSASKASRETEDKIFGIIHCTQPSLGAVDTYMRMKAGQWADPFGIHLLDALLSIPESLFQLGKNIIQGKLLEAAKGYLKDKATGMVIEAVTGLTRAAGQAVQALGMGAIGWAVDHGTAQVVGSSGQLVSAVMYHCLGGLELLPSKFYHIDMVSDPAQAQVQDWLSVFYDGGLFNSRVIFSLPSKDPFTDIYNVVFEDSKDKNKFWGLLHKSWVLPNTDDGLRAVQENLSTAQKFQEDLGLYHHPRTIQLVSNGGFRTSMFCEAVWICEDITQKIYKAVKYYLPYNTKSYSEYTAGSNLAKLNLFTNKKGEMSLVLSSSVPIEEALSTGNYQVLTYTELVHKALHAFGEAPNWTCRLGKHCPDNMTSQLYFFRCQLQGKVRTFYGQEMSNEGVRFPRSTTDGDGTVPFMSQIGLTPSIEAWSKGKGCVEAMQKYFISLANPKPCTYAVTRAEHQEFYDSDGREATLDSLHNLARLWIEENADKFDPSPLECNLSCMRSDDDPNNAPDKSVERV